MPLVSVFANRTSRLQTVHFNHGPHKYKCVHAYVFSTVFTCPTGIVVLAKKKNSLHALLHVQMFWNESIYLFPSACGVFDIRTYLAFTFVCLYSIAIMFAPARNKKCVCMIWRSFMNCEKCLFINNTKEKKKKKWRKASFILMLYLEYWSGNMRNHL